MVIEGLRTVPEQPKSANISDHVAANVEALDMIGLVEDRDQVTESVARDFEALTESGRTGESYIALPRGLITLSGLIEVSDSGNYNGKEYPESYVWSSLWTPGTSRGGYKADELDNLTFGGNVDFPVRARLAVHGNESQEEPLLHFLNKPFDEKYAQSGEQTQLEAIDKAVAAYEAEGHQDFAMTPLNAKGVAFIGLVRRIKGESMPFEWGYMRDGTLRRKTVGGRSVVGDVDSDGDEFYLGGSDGGAGSGCGVGLSVGPRVLES